jgi:hypothetical protein
MQALISVKQKLTVKSHVKSVYWLSKDLNDLCETSWMRGVPIELQLPSYIRNYIREHG